MQLAESRACMSPPISSSCIRALRPDREVALGGVEAFVDGWSSARSCRPIPPPPCAGRAISCGAARRRCLIRPEARQLIDAIDVTTIIGLRDRALIGLMVYSFARIGAAIGMHVDDVYPQNCRLWVRLHEKGGKQHAMPPSESRGLFARIYRWRGPGDRAELPGARRKRKATERRLPPSPFLH